MHFSSLSFIFNINNIFFFEEDRKAASEAKKICTRSILKENYELGRVLA